MLRFTNPPGAIKPKRNKKSNIKETVGWFPWSSLDHLNNRLYIDLDSTSLTWSGEVSDVTNEHAIIEGFEFPINTDYFLNSGVRIMLPGITVYAPMTGKVYVSMEAIQMIQAMA